MLDLMMPFHGDVGLLRQAVRSVLSQGGEWRLTVVDDASGDADLARWFDELADPRVHYVRHPENLGLNRNFQYCLEHAQADWVAFPGCDDLLLPGYVETVAAAATPGVAVIQPGVRVIDAAGEEGRGLADRVKARLRLPAGIHSGEPLAASLLAGNWTYFPSLVWHRERIAAVGFRPGLPVVLDWALLLEVIRSGGAMRVLDAEVFGYRRHRESASSLAAADASRFAEEAGFLGEEAARCDELGWPRAARAARLRLTSRLHALSRAGAALGRRDPRAAATSLRHALGK